MENIQGFFGWFISGINRILIALNLPVNGLGQFFVGGLIVILLILVLVIISDSIWYLLRGMRRSRSGTKSKESTKKIKKDKDPMEKRADLVYYQVNSPPKGSLKWERTGRGIRGVCLVKRRKTLQESEKMLLLFRFNGDWFFFRDSKLLVDYQIDLFDEELKLGKERGDSGFNWVGQPMKIHPKYTAQYEVEVDGHYPHLGQNEKRVSLVLVELEDVDVNEGFEDRFYLFEDTALIGGIAWQGRKIHIWTGGRLTEEEVAEIQEQYLEREINGVEADFAEMI